MLGLAPPPAPDMLATPPVLAAVAPPTPTGYETAAVPRPPRVQQPGSGRQAPRSGSHVLASLPANRSAEVSVGLPAPTAELPPAPEPGTLAAPPRRSRVLYVVVVVVTVVSIGLCITVWRSLGKKIDPVYTQPDDPNKGKRGPPDPNEKGLVQPVPGNIALSGEGSSFVDHMMQKWAGTYRDKFGVALAYKKSNSGSGVRELLQKRVAFACTDAYLSDKEMLEFDGTGGVVHVPLVMGAVVATYNLPEVPGALRFTPEVLVGIFMGEITRWNDSSIKACNPVAAGSLPDRPITVVHRSDRSGTTFIWTDYLSKVSEKWRKGPGADTIVKWPKGFVGAEKNDGVAAEVQKTIGAIGYVELSFALERKLRVAEIRNKSDDYIAPTLESVKAAAQKAEFGPDLRFTLTNVEGRGVYPICGTTWAVLYKKQPGVDRRELLKFLRWTVHEGQEYAPALNYAPLPPALVQKIDAVLAEVKPEP
jgi:phosphate transport system substrate-binding protein